MLIHTAAVCAIAFRFLRAANSPIKPSPEPKSSSAPGSGVVVVASGIKLPVSTVNVPSSTPELQAMTQTQPYEIVPPVKKANEAGIFWGVVNPIRMVLPATLLIKISQNDGPARTTKTKL